MGEKTIRNYDNLSLVTNVALLKYYAQIQRFNFRKNSEIHVSFQSMFGPE